MKYILILLALVTVSFSSISLGTRHLDDAQSGGGVVLMIIILCFIIYGFISAFINASISKKIDKYLPKLLSDCKKIDGFKENLLNYHDKTKTFLLWMKIVENNFKDMNEVDEYLKNKINISDDLNKDNSSEYHFIYSYYCHYCFIMGIQNKMKISNGTYNTPIKFS